MAGILRVTHDRILLALQARLMADLSLPRERVLIASRERIALHAQAQTYLVLRPMGLKPQKPIVHGAGRLDFRVVLTVSVTINNRVALDDSSAGDEAWLTDASLGQIQLEAAVINSLSVVPLEDAQGNWLLYEPPEFDYGAVPDKDKREPEWGQTALWFTLPFVFALDQTRG